MPSLRDIKRSIKSVKNTRQITKAMKMVSAAKLRRAQEDITAARPYAEKMNELIASLAAKIPSESHPLLAARENEGKVGVVLVTSDRGLCGSFNAVLLRTVEAFMRERGGSSDVRLNLVGRRAADYFKRRPVNVSSSRPFGGRPNYAAASAIARDVTALFTSGELDGVYLIYSEFKSALSQRPIVQRLLPISAPKSSGESDQTQTDVIYEPSAEEVLSMLLPKYVEGQIFRALLESAASEHGARMTAMDSASKNASEMIGGLTLKYNRLRQAAITKELMEIISGAEALKE